MSFISNKLWKTDEFNAFVIIYSHFSVQKFLFISNNSLFIVRIINYIKMGFIATTFVDTTYIDPRSPRWYSQNTPWDRKNFQNSPMSFENSLTPSFFGKFCPKMANFPSNSAIMLAIVGNFVKSCRLLLI